MPGLLGSWGETTRWTRHRAHPMRSDITIAPFSCDDRQRGPARLIKIAVVFRARKRAANLFSHDLAHFAARPSFEKGAQSAALSSPPTNPGRLQPSLIAAARRPNAATKPARPAGQKPRPSRSSTVNTDAPSRAAVM
jgi:hypothetical protein